MNQSIQEPEDAPVPGEQHGGYLATFLDQPYIKLIRESVHKNLRRIIFMGVVSGIANGTIVAIINAGATSQQKNEGDLIRYVLMFAIAVITYLYASNYLLTQSVVHGEAVVRRFRTSIADRIRRSELTAFDELETTQVFVALSDNTNRISQATLPIFNACGAIVMLSFCLCYIFTISPAAFIITIVITFTMVMLYMQVSEHVEALYGQAYSSEKSYFHMVQQLLGGIKEVKMSRARSDDIFNNFIQPRAIEAQGHKVNANELYVRNLLNTRLFIFLITASFVFGLPAFSMIENNDIMSLTAVALFMFSPIGAVVEAIPLLAQANVAVNKLRELEKHLIVSEIPVSETQEEVATKAEGMSLQDANFSFRDHEGNPVFTVGPVNLDIKPGEVTFLVGGNGSGKSTLLKMITGLYPLSSGSLTIDRHEITDENRTWAREHFSAIFADFHLFDHFYGLSDTPPEKVNALIEQMRLSHKTQYRDGSFTNLELSTGQRKRLALIVSLLEDRPIYIFDEVASDQDPEFRMYFYKEVLGELKAQGKTLLIVSHDREFFGMADKIYRLDYGKLVRPDI
jgi:putative ATP-binding cassette transporter